MIMMLIRRRRRRRTHSRFAKVGRGSTTRNKITERGDNAIQDNREATTRNERRGIDANNNKRRIFGSICIG
mgnify:CR=1 FL=1